MVKITIFGLAGTGKTTAGKLLAEKLLAEKLDYTYMSSGEIFRSFASEMNMTLNDFENLAAINDEYDKKLDDRVALYGKKNNNFVFESRLAWYFIPDSIKIKLQCDFDTRISRISERENKDNTLVQTETKHREDSIRKRYKEYYGIENFEDDRNFDLVIDTSKNNVYEVIKIIQEFLDK